MWISFHTIYAPYLKKYRIYTPGKDTRVKAAQEELTACQVETPVADKGEVPGGTTTQVCRQNEDLQRNLVILNSIQILNFCNPFLSLT